jgi:hypothetical protein
MYHEIFIYAPGCSIAAYMAAWHGCTHLIGIWQYLHSYLGPVGHA